MMVSANYLSIPIETEAKTPELRAIDAFFSKFAPDEAYLECRQEGLTLYVNRLDFFEFKQAIEDFQAQSSPRVAALLGQILEKVENVKSYGLKGKKRLYVGYDKERKVKNRQQKEQQRGQYFYARDARFSSQNNVLPEAFKNQILVGDSQSVLSRLPDNCVDLIFTSPPYNFGLDYAVHEDQINWQAYFDKLFAVFSECIRVLKWGGRIVVNVQPLFSDYIPIHHIISNFMMEQKLIWKGEILWDKHNYNCKYTAWGSWKSPSNPYLKYTWEFLEIFCKGDLKHEGKPENADITGDEFKKWVYAKWDIAPEMNMKKYDHPAMFPEALAERAIKLFSFQGDVVLDPFNGAGTTTAVAKRLGRVFVGIDISEAYCAAAKERINQIAPLFDGLNK